MALVEDEDDDDDLDPTDDRIKLFISEVSTQLMLVAILITETW